MDQPLPRATPPLAKTVWQRQKRPSARSVARALTLSGRPVHFTTFNRWRGRDWRVATNEHPLEQARADLSSALTLVTGNPTSTIDDLIGSRPRRDELEQLTDAQLLRRAARELAMAVVMVAHVVLLAYPGDYDPSTVTPDDKPPRSSCSTQTYKVPSEDGGEASINVVRC